MHKRILSRRTFLRETILGATVLSAAQFLPGYRAFAFPPGEPFKAQFFSPHELLILRAVADRLIGPSPATRPGAMDIGVAERADRFLAEADPEVQEQIHLLLSIFNAKSFAFLFDFRFSSFIDMRPDIQDAHIDDWMTSRLGFRRTGFQALKRLCMSMFYTDERTFSEIGYTPLYVPEGQQ
jgi:hypothetical protein